MKVNYPGCWLVLVMGLYSACLLISRAEGGEHSFQCCDTCCDTVPADIEGACFELVSAESRAKRFLPLVMQNNGDFDVNPIFKEELPNILQAIRLSYDVAINFFLGGRSYRDPQAVLFSSLPSYAGWQISCLTGKTGIYFKDIPGIIAFHRHRRVLTVALHGSILPGDWLVNPDCRKITSDLHALDIPGKIHCGFATKVSNFQDNLKGKLAKIFANLTSQEKDDLLIFVTGHSQGAALAQLAGPVVVTFLREHWKADFDNTVENKVLTFRLAAVRCLGDQQAYEGLLRIMGANNNIRQNMSWDCVPAIIPGEDFGGHRNGGMLALQRTLPVLKENFIKHFLQLRMHSFKGFCSFILNALLNPHFVSNLSPGNAAFIFDPSLVDLNTRRLLAQGCSHVQKKSQRLQSSFVCRSMAALYDLCVQG